MLPIIGPPENSDSLLTNLQSEQADEQTNTTAETGESREESSPRSGAGNAVRLDLGSSGENGVHQETARFIAERSIQIQISQSFSFQQQNLTESAVDSENNPETNSPAEQSARNIAGEAERFLPRFLEESGGSEEDARQEFQEIISSAVEEGLRQAQQELNGGLDSEIENLFQNMQTALDRFIEVFGEVEGSAQDSPLERNETPESAENQTQGLEQTIGNQNQQAAASTVPENLSRSLIPR